MNFIAHDAQFDAGASGQEFARVEFRAMGNDVDIILVEAPARTLEAMQSRILQLHERWTRFDSSSELMKVNNNPGHDVVVSQDTIELVECMMAGFDISNGLFDARLLTHTLTRGFVESQSDPQVKTMWTARGLPVDTREQVSVNRSASTVRVPKGIGLDPGGIGKGLAADIVVREAIDAGAQGVCVTVGGEVRVAGRAPSEGHWRVGVTAPDSDDNLDVLALVEGAAATSNADGWLTHGRSHIVDPRDASRAPTLLQATAVCGYAWQAEVLAKALVLQDPESAIDFADNIGCHALVVTRDLETYETSGWESLCI